ncbi:MAG: hypothetical protein JOZ91_07725 [Candidatus Eremiobacteraeota bacterium]|nr:hypothetical protein [Candidatus Eremiobacteraeota bacterium]MBV8263781.1 hypothetical protein [Candidatus Eremiobacteraeota bacterium]MBV8340103.1 hypothetical protein [Candidatus Eremiobacteraeota bacterium]MBV8460517.1 hypothetical protein [Candidatus Eremiobacteraeota bacterium]MBV8595447.1 hypothetical protein [Candidatus Eremiobacteraeota bacterium]
MLKRFLTLWLAFAIGVGLGSWLTSRYIGSCDAKIIDVDTDALTIAAQQALPGAITGSGVVIFTLSPTGIRVQSDSMFANQSFDTRVLAVTRGSPVKLEISAKLLQKLLSH